MTHRVRAPLLTLLLLAAACHSATEPVDFARQELAAARHRWAAAGVQSYGYELWTASAWFADRRRIEVRDGVVTSVIRLEVPSQVTPPPASSGLTVPQLFDRIQSAIDTGSPVTASYDPHYGYPLHVDAPDPPRYADYGWDLTVTQFAPAP